MPNENTNNDTQSQNEPLDIAQAFRLYNQMERKDSQESLDNGEAGDGDSEAEFEEPEGTGSDDEESSYSEEGGSISDSDEDYDDGSGGSASVVEPVDYNPAKQAVLKNIQNEAIRQVRAEMAEQQIELWSMEDIYERDENTGRVIFHNPDDPNRPFSSRAEAQQFIDAMNKEVTNHFRNEVNKKQRELIQQATPQLQMFDYAPTYNAMSEAEQKVFNNLIEPYAIFEGEKVVGFNTNLVAAGNVARKIAKNFEQPAQQQQPQQQGKKQKEPGSRPATDMPTGNGASSDEEFKDPKDISEAMRIYNAQQKEQRIKELEQRKGKR